MSPAQRSTELRGIYAYRFDSKTGKLTSIGRVADVVSPHFSPPIPTIVFFMSPQKQDQDAEKDRLSQQLLHRLQDRRAYASQQGRDGLEAHAIWSVDKTGRILFVANYGNGTVASFALKQDGSIGQKTGFDQHTGKGPNAERQEGPHAHAVVISPDNRFLFVPDLGSDQIKIYRVDAAKVTFTPTIRPSLRSTQG